jgi:uncharacterized protein
MLIKDEVSFDDYDEIINPKSEDSDFDHIVDEVVSRRGFLNTVVTIGVGAFLMGTSGLTKVAQASGDRFGFNGVTSNSFDTVTLPSGYKWESLIHWGDPLWSDGLEFDPVSRGTAASQELSFGDNNDGMSLFLHEGHHLMVANNEHTNRSIIYGNRAFGLPETSDDVNKGKAAHGVSIFEIEQNSGNWSFVKDSSFNRRITADTEMEITGPAAGHDLLKTGADPTGTKSLGTWNNCGNGETPWGTYLACEENFNGYFSSSDPTLEIHDAFKRYGISAIDWGYGWATEDERFDISKHPNEPNRAGYVVEIDPTDPTSTPKKRTALGRFKHENAEVVIAKDGRLVVYMGDDERGEFLYRFVSDDVYSADGDNSDLLNQGRLYAARFYEDQTGEWLALTPEATGMTEAEICIHTRMAASAVSATTMDRPEWVAANPNQVEVYCALTNNKHRGRKPNKGGDEMPVAGPNPRKKNLFGQIVRWVPNNRDHSSDQFTWDLFAMAGNPMTAEGGKAGSSNITPDNMFNSPDGLAFDNNGMLWIQTDGNYSNEGLFEGMGNNQMLVGDTTTGEIRRFMVGPREAEITGLCWSSDRRTLFVGVQHPGQKGNSSFPGGGNSVPRSGIIAVSREDGELIG